MAICMQGAGTQSDTKRLTLIQISWLTGKVEVKSLRGLQSQQNSHTHSNPVSPVNQVIAGSHIFIMGRIKHSAVMAMEEISTMENMMEIMSVMLKIEMTLYVIIQTLQCQSH